MKLLLLAVAALLMQDAKFESVFDQPMGNLSGAGGETPLDRMSLNQLMRLSTLPQARLLEFRCAGAVSWPGSDKGSAFALADAQRKDFVDRVAAAVAHDVEMDKDIALGLINAFSGEELTRKDKKEIAKYRAELKDKCAPLLGKVRTGNYELAPLAQPSVVNTTLATCYARYTIAAENAVGEEAAGLRRTATKAEQLALAGKEGAALDAARKALADELAAEHKRPTTEDGDDMMRLVICLPAMDAAKTERDGK